MEKARRWVELVVGVTKAQLLEQAAGGLVAGVVAGEEGLGAELAEGVGDDGAGRLRREASAPELLRKWIPSSRISSSGW